MMTRCGMSMITDQVWLVCGTCSQAIGCGTNLSRNGNASRSGLMEMNLQYISSAFLAFLKGDVESGEGGNPSLASLKRNYQNKVKDIG